MAEPTCPAWCERQHPPNEGPYRTHSIRVGTTSRSGRDLEVWIFRYDRRRPASGEWKTGARTVSIGLADEIGHDTGIDDLTPDQAAKLARIVEAIGDPRLARLLDKAANTTDRRDDV